MREIQVAKQAPSTQNDAASPPRTNGRTGYSPLEIASPVAASVKVETMSAADSVNRQPTTVNSGAAPAPAPTVGSGTVNRELGTVNSSTNASAPLAFVLVGEIYAQSFG
ncbi:MAG TPA: hypothetical protein VKC60_01780 [Opitutaceae bacterium]|nr:hypothetical protein [Opitutaceae bacterium]